MEIENKKKSLIWFSDLLKKFTYPIESEGMERTKDIIKRIYDKLNVSNEDYIVGMERIKNYLNSINRGSNFIENLDSKLIKAIEIYVGSAYKEINDSLRKNKGLVIEKNAIISYTTDYINIDEVKLEGVIDALDNVISKTELTQEIILYRAGGISKFKELNITSPEELVLAVGKKIIEHGYSSTSVDFEGFWCENCPIVMVNKVLPGTHICSIGFSKRGLNTGEILIERDVEYTIVDIEIIGNQIFVYTEVKQTELTKEIKNVEDIDLNIKENNKKSAATIRDEYFYFDDYDFEIPEIDEELNNKTR